MRQVTFLLACISLVLLAAGPAGSRPLREVLPPNSSVTRVRIEAFQAADRPVLLTLILTNTGDKPLALGPQPYPPLSNAEVRITDAKGDARKMALSNGDW